MYSIQDETLKKYVLENFLEKLKVLTPNQNSNKRFNYLSYKKKKDYRILKETKILYQKRQNLSKIQIIEFSILFLVLNYLNLAIKRLEALSSMEFLDEKNENLKSLLINSITEGQDKDVLRSNIESDYNNIIRDINENTNFKFIAKNKTNEEILDLIDELIRDHQSQKNLKKKIESLEQKLINNLDENSFSELIKLKSQLNRD